MREEEREREGDSCRGNEQEFSKCIYIYIYHKLQWQEERTFQESKEYEQ